MTLTHYIGGKIAGNTADFDLPLSTNYPNLTTFTNFETFTEFILVDGAWRQIGLGFQPPVANINVWYDASDSSSVIKDGSDRVSQWLDKSENLLGQNLTQLTSLEQPLFVAVDQNGLSVIDCSGDRFMKTVAWASEISQPYAFFFTAKLPSNVGNDKYMLDSLANQGLVYKQTTANRFLRFAGDNAGFTEAGFTDTWRYVTVVFDGANLIYRFNGVNKNDEGTTVGTLGSNGLLMGARDGNGFSNWTVGEIIMSVGLPTAQEITDVETYLKDKWGL